MNEEDVLFLCFDADGYKRYDTETDRWIYLSDEITVEQIQEYGVNTMTTDDGLLDEYEIVLFDAANVVDAATITVVPPKQTISTSIQSDMAVAHKTLDAEFHPSDYIVDFVTKCTGAGTQSRITLNINVEKLCDANQPLRIYCTQIFSK